MSPEDPPASSSGSPSDAQLPASDRRPPDSQGAARDQPTSSFAPPIASPDPDSDVGQGIRVLVASDESLVRRYLARILLSWGFSVLTAEGAESALPLLSGQSIDVLLADFSLAAFRGEHLIDLARRQRPDLEVVVMAGAPQLARASAWLRHDAHCVIAMPPASEETVVFAIARAAESRRLRFATEPSPAQGAAPRGPHPLESSASLRRMLRLATAAASVDAPVLIAGETGTGRKLLARWIHEHGARASRPFIVVDCAAVPAETLAKELFGSDPDKPGGALESATGGSLLLDDVAELPHAAQLRLLRLLEGGAPARVLATCTGDPKLLVEAGTLRDDLLYRLQVIAIHMPPLRKRKDDIPVIAYESMNASARRLGRDVTRISQQAMRRLREYSWPGNLRELDNVVERAVALARGNTILPSDLTLAADSDARGDQRSAPFSWPAELADLPFAEAKSRAVDVFEKAYVAATLERAGGNISEAARQSGLDRSNFRRVLKKRSKR